MTKRRREPNYPTSNDLRDLVMARAKLFSTLSNTSMSDIGLLIAKDQNLLNDLPRGRNITFKTYDLIMKFFDENWPTGAAA